MSLSTNVLDVIFMVTILVNSSVGNKKVVWVRQHTLNDNEFKRDFGVNSVVSYTLVHRIAAILMKMRFNCFI